MKKRKLNNCLSIEHFSNMEKMEVEIATNGNNDDSQSQLSTENFQEKKLDQLFRVLRPLCPTYLDYSQIITHLKFINTHASKIQKIERKSAKEATELFFDLITKSDEPEKWTKFKVALKKEEFLSLYNVCDVCENNEFNSYIEIFDLLSVDFAENGVDIGKLSERMMTLDSLTKTQFEKIVELQKEEGENAAILEFMSYLPSDWEKRLKDLSSCLLELNKTDLHNQIQKKDKIEVNGNDDSPSQLSTENFQEKNLKELLRVLRPLCLTYLKPSQIITHLEFINTHASKIKKTERKSAKEAMELFFDLITKSDDPEKWTKFKVALKEEEFLSLYNVCDVCENNEFNSYIEIFDLLSVDFAENGVDIGKLSESMMTSDSLTKTEFEKIIELQKEEGEISAILEFMSYLPSDWEKRLKDLSSCLLELNKTDLHNQIQKKDKIEVNGNDDSPSQLSTENFQEKNLKELLRVLRPLCLTYLKPSQIITHLEFINTYANKIKKTERKSAKEAMELFFDLITKSDDPEKWTKFKVALKEEEFLSLYNVCDVCENNEFNSYIEIFDLLSVDFSENGVDIGKLSESMMMLDSLTKTQFEKIVELQKEEGEISAILEFMSYLPSDWEKRLKDLCSCLLELNKTDLHNLIQKKVGPSKKDLPEIEKNNEECKNPDITEKEKKVEKKQIQLRNYQKELLEEPLKRKNCIIYAPTGCGKTIVAMKLIEEHFAQKDEQIHKVIFLANQVALVQQQGRQCKEYLSLSTGIVTGSNDVSAGDIPLKDLIRDNDVIVMTPQVLLNNLKENCLPTKSLSQFSLMIFDECHHTNKKHPYNGLMAMYLDEKLEGNGYNLPQIVGLTASIGVGGASTIKETMAHIQIICANLDCDEICSIKRHRQELFSHVNNPNDDNITVHGLTEDPFKDGLNKMMEAIEDRFKERKLATVIKQEIPALFEKLHECFTNREKDYYTNWLGDIKKQIVLLRSDIRWSCLDCWAFLNMYHNALIINDSARIKDAIAYIERNLQPSSELSTYSEIQRHWEAKKTSFQILSKNPKYFNPLLAKLEEIIVDSIKKTPDSRILLFLKTRALVNALEDWIKESEKLKDLNPQQLVGGSKKTDNSGMSTQQQEKKLFEFKIGQCKILVATLGEEGIDIKKCNLVLNYNHVKNEISSVQKRGRARAENSQYITLAKYDSGIYERECNNKNREIMMDKALEIVQQQKNEDPQKYVKMKQEQQLKDKTLRDFELKSKRRLQPGEYDLFCMRCNTHVCSSSEIRSVNESQHTCLNSEFESRVSVKPHPRPKKFGDMTKLSKIFCKTCNNDFGIKAIFKKCEFPIIKVSSFVMCDVEGNRCYEKKWKDVPFQVQEITTEELKLFPFRIEVANQDPSSQ